MADGPKAVVLLSGGLDSTTTLAVAARDGYEVCALTLCYGQRHAIEVEAARRVAAQFRVTEHAVINIDLRLFGGSALTDDIDVPKDRSPEQIGHGIPVTYVPARNTIFLSFALAWAEVLGADDIYLGVNVLDCSGYPDCRPEYIAAFQRMANLATKAGVADGRQVTIHTPLIALSKAQIIDLGRSLGVDYERTLSCYDPAPGPLACGRCDACLIRLRGFVENGLTDPAAYMEQPANH